MPDPPAIPRQPAVPVPFAAYGARSMTAPLADVLVQRPGRAFGRAFDDPAHGFHHAVDLEQAQAEHDAFVGILRDLGVAVHELGSDSWHPDLTYTYDPLLVGDVRVFDVPFWRGPAELLHLLSVISPVADDLAVVYLPLLPAGLWELLGDIGIRLIGVPDEEMPTLGCNVLAVRPGVCVVADGSPVTRRALEAAGCEVHAYAAHEIGLNGSGGPTCLTRPILRRE